MPDTPSILLVEDDQKLGRQILDTLRSAGFRAAWATRGDAAMDERFDALDLVILDLMLPGAHGLDVLKFIRASAHSVPVLVLSARQDTTDKVRAFGLGADDYLTKPFWPEELLARVRARLRRPSLSAAPHAVSAGPLRIDLDALVVSVHGAAVDLTKAEFEILASLARRPGAAVSRAALVERALAPHGDGEGDDRTLDVHVSRIRRKLGDAGALIATVWGVGYRLKVDR